MLLVNFLHVLVLFDSGEILYSFSLAFNESFCITMGALDHPYMVAIVDDCTVSASMIARYVSEVFDRPYSHSYGRDQHIDWHRLVEYVWGYD